MNTGPVTWYLIRSAGIVAYGLLTLSVLAGLVLKSRPFTRLRPAAAMQLHRTLASAALVATAAHATGLLLDATVDVGIADLLIPGVAPYRPVWTAAGVIAAELMVVVSLSFRFRAKLGRGTWRRLHWATYGIFALATVHGLLAGTDSGRGWMLAIYVGAVAAVIAATTWRAIAPPARPARRSPQPGGAPAEVS